MINIICQEGKYNQLKVEYFIYGIIKREELYLLRLLKKKVKTGLPYVLFIRIKIGLIYILTKKKKNITALPVIETVFFIIQNTRN